MTVGAAIVALMGLDTAFAGYRAAAGRSGHVRIAARQGRAMAIGGALGWLTGAMMLFGVSLTGGPWPSLVQAGSALVVGYGLFGAVVAFAFLARALPSVDLKAASSIVVFGPFTLVRPAWIVLVAVWACWGTEPRTAALVAVGVALVLAIEQAQEHWLHAPSRQ